MRQHFDSNRSKVGWNIQRNFVSVVLRILAACQDRGVLLDGESSTVERLDFKRLESCPGDILLFPRCLRGGQSIGRRLEEFAKIGDLDRQRIHTGLLI